MKVKMLCSMLFVVVVVMLTVAPLELSAKTLGMVADNDTDSVTVFDADTHAILGTVPISPGDPLVSVVGDVLITPDLKRGFATNRDHQVNVIDPTTSPPGLAGGTNPIPTSNFGLDLSISPDGKFLIVAGGGVIGVGAPGPLSVIDINAQTEVGTFFTGDESNDSVDVCSDGSVLVTSFLESGTVRRFTLSGAGVLTDTGEVLSVRFPTNVYCAPGAQSGIVTRLEGVTSFTIPGLTEVDNRVLSGASGSAGAINSTGNQVFVRSSRPTGTGIMDVFDFNPSTGALGASPLLTFFVGESPAPIGMESIALHPNDGKLFVSEFGVVNVYDPVTGALLDSITDPNIAGPTGVTVVTEADPCAGTPPPGAIVGANGPDILNGTPGNDTIIGLGGSDLINGGGGNDVICGGAGNDLINGGAGNDFIDGGPGFDTLNGGPGIDTCVNGEVTNSCS